MLLLLPQSNRGYDRSTSRLLRSALERDFLVFACDDYSTDPTLPLRGRNAVRRGYMDICDGLIIEVTSFPIIRSPNLVDNDREVEQSRHWRDTIVEDRVVRGDGSCQPSGTAVALASDYHRFDCVTRRGGCLVGDCGLGSSRWSCRRHSGLT